ELALRRRARSLLLVHLRFVFLLLRIELVLERLLALLALVDDGLDRRIQLARILRRRRRRRRVARLSLDLVFDLLPALLVRLLLRDRAGWAFCNCRWRRGGSPAPPPPPSNQH